MGAARTRRGLAFAHADTHTALQKLDTVVRLEQEGIENKAQKMGDRANPAEKMMLKLWLSSISYPI
jgi:hypothetical protein